MVVIKKPVSSHEIKKAKKGEYFFLAITTADSTWHFAENQFNNSTKRSYHRGNMIFKLIDDLFAAEPGDADITAAYNVMHPDHVLYLDLYSDWLAKIGLRIGEVNRWENMRVDIMDTQLAIWKAAVITAGYPKKSSDYKIIFPNGSDDFDTDISTFIAELKALSKRINNYPLNAAMVALKATVDGVITTVSDQRLLVDKLIEGVNKASDLLEAKRVVCSKNDYGELGMMMKKFKENPTDLERLYPLEIIRNTGSGDDVVIIIPPGQIVMLADILKKKWTVDTILSMSNVGPDFGFAYGGNTITTPYSGVAEAGKLDANVTKVFRIGELLNPLTKFLLFYNPGALEARIIISVIAK